MASLDRPASGPPAPAGQPLQAPAGLVGPRHHHLQPAQARSAPGESRLPDTPPTMEERIRQYIRALPFGPEEQVRRQRHRASRRSTSSSSGSGGGGGSDNQRVTRQLMRALLLALTLARVSFSSVRLLSPPVSFVCPGFSCCPTVRRGSGAKRTTSPAP